MLIELETAGDPYRLAVQVIHMLGAHAIRQAELKDGKAKTMMYYQPARGWYYNDERDKVLP